MKLVDIWICAKKKKQPVKLWLSVEKHFLFCIQYLEKARWQYYVHITATKGSKIEFNDKRKRTIQGHLAEILIHKIPAVVKDGSNPLPLTIQNINWHSSSVTYLFFFPNFPFTEVPCDLKIQVFTNKLPPTTFSISPSYSSILYDPP